MYIRVAKIFLNAWFILKVSYLSCMPDYSKILIYCSLSDMDKGTLQTENKFFSIICIVVNTASTVHTLNHIILLKAHTTYEKNVCSLFYHMLFVCTCTIQFSA